MLLETIRKDLDYARKEKNQRLLTLLTTLYSEAAMVGKTKRNSESTDDEVISVVKKFKAGVEEIKSIKGTSIDIEYELELYNSYLPVQLGVEELKIIINNIVEELPEKTIKQLGIVMGKLKAGYSGLYDGAFASTYIKELLK